MFLGVGVVVASALGASYGLRKSEENKPRPAPTPTELTKVVSFGHVDAPNGVAYLTFKVSGQVEKIFVEENKIVEAGASLVQLDDFDARHKLQMAQLALGKAKIELSQAERAVRQHADAVADQQIAIDQAKAGLGIAEAERALLRRLEELNQTNKQEVAKAEEALKLANLRILAEETRLQRIRDKKPDLEQLVEQANLNIRLQEIQVEQAKRLVEEHVLKAPFRGYVLREMINVGELISPQREQPALIFCPDKKVIVRAEIDQEFADLVHKGMSARIKDYTREGKEWKGEVTQVSNWFAKRRSMLFEPRQVNDIRTLECIIELESGHEELRIGQRVRVILQKKEEPKEAENRNDGPTEGM